MSKFLILGSNSFAGSAFTNYCINKECSVLGVNRSTEQHSIFLPVLKNPLKENYHFNKLDLNVDSNKILKLVDDFEPDYIVDFAGQGMVAESWDNPYQWYQTNIVSKAKLHRFLIGKPYLKNYIRISTPEVYGSNEGLIDETCNMNPSTPYAISHMATDLSIKALSRNFSFPILIGRFANFYGPHQQLYRIIPKTIISILTNKVLNLHGGGKSIRAFIHSDDVCEGIFKMIKNGTNGETYHFSPKEFFNIKEVVEIICSELDADFNKVTKVTEDREGKDFAYLMDCSKSHTELRWEAKISLKNGIKQTIDWVKDNLEVIEELSLEYKHKE